jgi:hypothetical protein
VVLLLVSLPTSWLTHNPQGKTMGEILTKPVLASWFDHPHQFKIFNEINGATDML